MPNVIGYTPHFASSTAIEPGSVLATDADGRDLFRVLFPLRTFTNVVGGRTFLAFQVHVLATGEHGTMMFAADDMVYLRTEYVTEGNQL